MSSVIRPFFFNLHTTATPSLSTIRTTYNALKTNPELGKLLTNKVALGTLGACVAGVTAYCGYKTLNSYDVSPLDVNPLFEQTENLMADTSFPTVSISEELNVQTEKFMPVNCMHEYPQNLPETKVSFSSMPSASEVIAPASLHQPIERLHQNKTFADASKGECKANPTNFNFSEKILPKLKSDFSQLKANTEFPKKEASVNESYMNFSEAKSSFSEFKPLVSTHDDFEDVAKNSLQYEFPIQKEPVNHKQDESWIPQQESDEAYDYTLMIAKTSLVGVVLLGLRYAHQTLQKRLKIKSDDALVQDYSSQPILYTTADSIEPKFLPLNEESDSTVDNPNVANLNMDETQEMENSLGLTDIDDDEKVQHLTNQSNDSPKNTAFKSPTKNNLLRDITNSTNDLQIKEENSPPNSPMSYVSKKKTTNTTHAVPLTPYSIGMAKPNNASNQNPPDSPMSYVGKPSKPTHAIQQSPMSSMANRIKESANSEPINNEVGVPEQLSPFSSSMAKPNNATNQNPPDSPMRYKQKNKVIENSTTEDSGWISPVSGSFKASRSLARKSPAPKFNLNALDFEHEEINSGTSNVRMLTQ